MIKYIKFEDLVPHEQTDQEQVMNVLHSLKTQKILKNAVVIDTNSKLILDWHHRFAALRKLWVKYIPTLSVDYSSDDINLWFWREWFSDSKQQIIENARKWILYPVKTTKHTFNVSTEINLEI